MREHFQRMFHYAAWAGRRTIHALRAAPASAINEALPLVAHTAAAEHVWLSRIAGREPRCAVWPTLTLDEIEALIGESESGYRELLGGAEGKDLGRVVRYRNAQGQPFETALVDILTQVATHGPYHRGQVAKILARHGATPPATDYILFARETGAGA